MKRSGFAKLTYAEALEKHKLSQSKARVKVKKPKIPTKKTVRNRLDKLWGEVVRSNRKCEVCGKTGYLNAHHIIGRTDLRTRWDIRNGICLCSGCHTMNNQSAHENPIWFMYWMKEYKTKDLKYLTEIMKIPPTPYSVQDYLKIEEELQSL